MTTSPLFVLLAEENKPIDRVYTMPKHFENRTKSCHLFNHIIAVITLAGLFMHVGTDCSWFDERTDLNSHVHTSRMMFNRELGCCIKSDFVCSNIREEPLSIRQAVYNM